MLNKMFYTAQFAHKQRHLFERATDIAQSCYSWILNTDNLEQWKTTERYIELAKKAILKIKKEVGKDYHNDIDTILYFIDDQYKSNHPMIDYIH